MHIDSANFLVMLVLCRQKTWVLTYTSGLAASPVTSEWGAAKVSLMYAVIDSGTRPYFSELSHGGYSRSYKPVKQFSYHG